MPHEIVQRTLSGEVKNGVLLDNLHPPLVRTMDIGNDWTTLRIAVRISTQRTAVTTSPQFFYLGVCSGTTAPPGSTTPNHFIGCSTTSANWTYGATTGMGFGWRYLKIVNGVETAVNAFASADANGPCIANNTVARSVLKLEITKGATWTIRSTYRRSGNLAGTCTNAAFEELMGASIGALPSVHSNNITNSTLTVDETTNGPLDTICCVFLDPNGPFEVYDFKYAKLA